MLQSYSRQARSTTQRRRFLAAVVVQSRGRTTPPAASTSAFWLRPVPEEPAYNKYRSYDALEKLEQARMWELANPERDMEARPVTFWSVVSCIPGWFKFVAVPLPFRYIFYVLWRSLLGSLFAAHKEYVRRCCKLEAAVRRSSPDMFRTSGGKQASFSRTAALLRLHGKSNLLKDARDLLALKRSTGVPQ